MSWSVSAIGKSDAVAKSLEEKFGIISVSGPEVAVVEAAREFLRTVLLSGQIPTGCVRVEAGGSQSVVGQKDGPDKVSNSVSIKVEPVWGWVE